MRKLLLLTAVLFITTTTGTTAQAHLVTKPKNDTLKSTLHSQTENLKHVRYVCRRGKGITKRWHCLARRWLIRERKETLRRIDQANNPYRSAGYWANIQILYATKIAWSSREDPWPNCPDPGPRDNQGSGHTWYDTVACENHGNWLDSPGYYRCGLQFDPDWEVKYKTRFCP